MLGDWDNHQGDRDEYFGLQENLVQLSSILPGPSAMLWCLGAGIYPFGKHTFCLTVSLYCVSSCFNATLGNLTSRSFLNQQETSLLSRAREKSWLPLLSPHSSGICVKLLTEYPPSFQRAMETINNIYFIGLVFKFDTMRCKKGSYAID